MQCMKCGAKTRVLETRDPAGAKIAWVRKLAETHPRVLVRRRRCPECGHDERTIELPLDVQKQLTEEGLW